MLHVQNRVRTLFHSSREPAIETPVRPSRATSQRTGRELLAPFELIRRSIEISTVRGELRVNLSYENFVNLLRTMIRGVEVNEAWYARTYEDIGMAIRDGIIRSARQHFIDDGYFEGRLPFAIVVDEA